MKKGLLIVNEFIKTNKERFSALYQDLECSFKNIGIRLEKMTNCEALLTISENNLPDFDFILFWDKDINLAYHLENLGYKVYNNAKAIDICDDKAKTALALENSGIKMPKTIIAPFTFSNNPYSASDLAFLESVIKYLGFPIVVKEAQGSFGEQVYLVNTLDELSELVLRLSPKTIVFQEYIASSFGRDIRIEVVGGEALGAVMRKSEKNDFRSNVLQGGKMYKCEPDQSYYEMALKVCDIIGLDFGGIDIMIGDNDEPIFCEVNSNVHFRTFKSITGVNLADEVARYISKKI